MVVAAPPERVWDFTQDYGQRSLWDKSVKSAEIIEKEPFVKVRIYGSDGSRLVFEYKLFERPNRTTLHMEVEQSSFFEKGGGSWTYESVDGGTLWTQVNSVQLRDRWWLQVLRPMIRWTLKNGAENAMKNAKKRIENEKTNLEP